MYILNALNLIFKDKMFGIFPVTDFIQYPESERMLFPDEITREEVWQSDDIFTQQRLGGHNPMLLRKLYEDGMKYTQLCKFTKSLSTYHMLEDLTYFIA